MPFKKQRAVAAGDRRAVAGLLAAKGPLPGDDAAGALGWSAERWWAVVGGTDDWFALTGKGWTLTKEGLAQTEV